MSKDKMDEDNGGKAIGRKDEPREPETMTLYTHGKKYTLPASTDVAEFLKATFPSEYK